MKEILPEKLMMIDNALSNNNTIQENMTRETKFNVLAQRERQTTRLYRSEIL